MAALRQQHPYAIGAAPVVVLGMHSNCLVVDQMQAHPVLGWCLSSIVSCVSTAEAWMTVGILTDDKPRYDKAVGLYHATMQDYFKWGGGKYRNYSGVLRVVGEATETMRDIYHTQFGIGGLLQTAEMAWQQVRGLECLWRLSERDLGCDKPQVSAAHRLLRV